jgi:hypothetical protein
MMDVAQLVDDLARPMFVYRMARSCLSHNYTPALKLSSQKRMDTAERQIEDIVRNAVARTE